MSFEKRFHKRRGYGDTIMNCALKPRRNESVTWHLIEGIGHPSFEAASLFSTSCLRRTFYPGFEVSSGKRASGIADPRALARRNRR